MFALLVMVLCGASLAGAQTSAARKTRLTYQAQQKMTRPMNWKPVIVYHGGPIMAGPINLYVVYYGSFTAAQHSILDTFLQHVGGSKAFNVTTEYYDAQGQFIQNAFNYDPTTNSYDDAYSMGKTLSGDFFETQLLHNAVAGGHLPSDVNGIYILTISPDVALPDNVWCAYHAYSPVIIEGAEVAYAVAADPPSATGILGGCSGTIAIYHDKLSPNFDMGMDEVADAMIHELAETVSDPIINAWFTFTGEEMADVCNFNYGPLFRAPNGARANAKFGNRDYLVQQLWSMEDPVGCVQRH
jgi:Phosphate-induced protein 1 conserved region